MPTTSSQLAFPPKDVISSLSIDNLIFGLENAELKILLIKHAAASQDKQWALPGGWINQDENLRDAASRILHEHSGVSDIYLEQLKTFGKVDRFPDRRVVTVAYYALVSAEKYPMVETQGHLNASWHKISDLPTLLYDHKDILDYAIEQLRHKVTHEPIGFNLLPKKFTLLQLQELYEAILDMRFDKPNFRRKILKMNLLVDCKEKQTGVSHRAAQLYKFDEGAYKRLSKYGFTFDF